MEKPAAARLGGLPARPPAARSRSSCPARRALPSAPGREQQRSAAPGPAHARTHTRTPAHGRARPPPARHRRPPRCPRPAGTFPRSLRSAGPRVAAARPQVRNAGRRRGREWRGGGAAAAAAPVLPAAAPRRAAPRRSAPGGAAGRARRSSAAAAHRGLWRTALSAPSGVSLRPRPRSPPLPRPRRRAWSWREPIKAPESPLGPRRCDSLRGQSWAVHHVPPLGIRQPRWWVPAGVQGSGRHGAGHLPAGPREQRPGSARRASHRTFARSGNELGGPFPSLFFLFNLEMPPAP